MHLHAQHPPLALWNIYIYIYIYMPPSGAGAFGARPGWTQNRLGYPGYDLLWVSMAVAGCRCSACDGRGGFFQVVGESLHRGTKDPKCWVCWPAAQPLRGPSGLLKGVLLTERAGTKVLAVVGCPFSEAGGQVWV